MKQHSNACRSALLTIVGLPLWLPLSAQEVNVGWHDRMYLQPGDGVQLNREQEPTFSGLVAMSPTGTTTGGDTQTYVSFAQDTYDMINKLNINSSVSLNYLAFDGDVDASFFGRQTFNSDSLTFVVTTTRNFGTTKFTALNFSTNFWNQVATYQNNLKGAALYSAITTTFGTRYVVGYQSAAMVSVIYSFHYASASAKQVASLNASASYGNFSGYVDAFFSSASTNTTERLSYQFYSTDPYLAATNFGFVSAGTIQNIQQYSNFVAQVQNYANSMSQTNAKIMGYVLDPLWFGPGLLAQLGGYVPPNDVGNPLDPDGSSGFLQDYTALQAWKRTLDPWMLDGNALSWLNAQGRAIVQNSWFEAKDLLAEMKNIAVIHFTTGTPLNVPSDVTTFLNNLNTISLPKIYAMDNFVYSGDRYFIGRVDCGCRDLMIQIPFNNVSELENGANNGTLTTIYYDPVAFVNAQLNAYPSGNSTTPHGHLVNLFSGATGDWPCYTNVTENPDLNGYFLVSQPTTGADAAANWSLVISGGTDANGNPLVVDQMSLIDTSRGSCPGSCTIAITNLVSGQ